jgi:hypothetical protein
MTASPETPAGAGTSAPGALAAAQAELGVFQALGMGWRLMATDFWPLWTVALVATLLSAAGGLLGPVSIFILVPVIGAGVAYAVRRKMDGHRADVGDVFAGFQQRFGQSIVAFLPAALVGLVHAMLMMPIILAAVIGCIAVGEECRHDEEILIGILLIVAAALVLLALLAAAMLLVRALFWFVLVAVWDHPESGWAAVRESVRAVKSHYVRTIGFLIVACLIHMASSIVGTMLCGVGVYFTGPAALVWLTASGVYLYRSWTGRPLVSAPRP